MILSVISTLKGEENISTYTDIYEQNERITGVAEGYFIISVCQKWHPPSPFILNNPSKGHNNITPFEQEEVKGLKWKVKTRRRQNKIPPTRRLHQQRGSSGDSWNPLSRIIFFHIMVKIECKWTTKNSLKSRNFNSRSLYRIRLYLKSENSAAAVNVHFHQSKMVSTKGRSKA